jgi:integrase
VAIPSTLAEQFAEYVEVLKKRGKSKQTIRSYETTYRLYIQSGTTVIDDAAVELFLERYENIATRNKVLAHLCSFVTWLRRKYPAYTITTVGSFTLQQSKLALTLPVVVDDADALRFMAALKKISHAAHCHAVLLRNTGLRFSEAYDLTAANYWQPAPGLHAIRFRGKGRGERTVSLNAEALDAFEYWVSLDHKPHQNTIRNAYRKAEKEAGVRIKPHWFRHGVATKLRANGFSYEEISDLLGNTVEVCRQRYARVDYTSLGKMVDFL